MGRNLILPLGVGMPLLTLAFVPAANAQDTAPRPALGTEVFLSSDSDDTEVLRIAADFDLINESDEERLGIRLEKAWYDPAGSGTRERERVFLQAADIAGKWSWSARVGTDGDSVIGSASVHDDSAYRKEFFISRDVLDTRQGLGRGIYSTFIGAAIDVPFDSSNVLTGLVGVQAFTGDNERFHLRANFVHVVKEEWGLSAQLRTRYFKSTEPGEFDYYSPEWYAQAMPVIQLRRFVGGRGLVGALGAGVQRDAASDWRQSNFAHFRFRTPSALNQWTAFGDVTYTETPSDNAATGSGYNYIQSRLGVLRRF